MAKLFQVSTYDALKRGNYDYTISIDYFLRNGDIGLGAYNGLNGEAIFLDGKAYNASSRGFVREMTIPQTGISFGQITKFNPEVDEICLTEVASLEDLKAKLEPVFERKGKNFFYVVKVNGTFSSIKVRSFGKQVKTYKPMDEIKEDEKEFTYTNEEGTLVGFFTPSIFKGLSSEGWHFHYLSSSLKHGGHVCELSAAELKYKANMIDKFEVKLPQNKEFTKMEF